MHQLLNIYEPWCEWSGMSIRSEKCLTFEGQKRIEIVVQHRPNLTICGGAEPTVELDYSFFYLWRSFCFSGGDKEAKLKFQAKLTNLLQITDDLKVKVQDQLKIQSVYIYSQILSELKMYRFLYAWIEQSLDSVCLKFARRRMELPVSACLKEVWSYQNIVED
jgi:hypothetical protein